MVSTRKKTKLVNTQLPNSAQTKQVAVLEADE
jgi:hypothetical protein